MANSRTVGQRSAVVLASFLVCTLVGGARVALAQASIAGVVRDTSGAVLPGVSVEAASPVLIEKVRTVVTDDAGQYRIEPLRPGTYTVTFSLQGFSTVKRDGVVLTGSFSATISPELRVGTVEETVTVTGASPMVDVQSADVNGGSHSKDATAPERRGPRPATPSSSGTSRSTTMSSTPATGSTTRSPIRSRSARRHTPRHSVSRPASACMHKTSGRSTGSL